MITVVVLGGRYNNVCTVKLVAGLLVTVEV